MKHRLTEGPVAKLIMTMTLPMIVGVLSTVAFNLVDTWFIGKLGTAALAAMSFTLPVVLLQGSIAMGLGVGASSVVARAIGRRDTTAVKQLTTSALFLSVALVIVVVSGGLLTIEPLFTLLGATDALLPLIREYMTVWYCGVPFIVIPMIGNNAIRATGNTMIPGMIMVLSVGLNALFDPLFIFGIGPFPEWGLRGAAVATVFTRMISLCISLYFLHFKFGMLTKKIASIHLVLDAWRRILFIALPAAFTRMLLPVTMGVLTKLISMYGESAIAALGVATRIEFFALVLPVALGTVLIPFTGQNMGAGNYHRIIEGYRFGCGFSLVEGAGVLGLFLLFTTGLAGIFTQKPEVITIVGLYLSLAAIGYGFQGITTINSAVFSALNKPFHAAAVNMLRHFVFFIPIVLIGSHYLGLGGIFGAVACASAGAGVVAWFWIKHALQGMKKNALV